MWFWNELSSLAEVSLYIKTIIYKQYITWNVCLNGKVVDVTKLSQTQRLNGVPYADCKVMSYSF